MFAIVSIVEGTEQKPRQGGFWRYGYWYLGIGLSLLLLAALHCGRVGGVSEHCQHLQSKSDKRNPLFGLRWQKDRWKGRIVRRLKAGPYTYLAVQRKAQKKPDWLVVWGGGSRVGSLSSLTVYGARKPFYSARLKRCFSTLFFGRIAPTPTKFSRVHSDAKLALRR